MSRRLEMWLVCAVVCLLTACAGGPPGTILDAPPVSEPETGDAETGAIVETETAEYPDDIIDDAGTETADAAPETQPLPQDAPLPYADLSDAEIHRMVKTDLSSLGPMSIGFTNSGALMNGMQMPPGPMWDIVNPRETWGTPETIHYLTTAIEIVNELYPDTPPIYIGDISDSNGGRLNRHLSHQAGRDADIGFYYKCGKGTWYTVGSSRNMDLPRNWALVRAILVHTDVELILLDKPIQRALYSYALSIGEDQAWLDSVFQYPGGRAGRIIRYSRGHHTHYHVRFFNPAAQEMGRRAYKFLIEEKKIKPPTYYVYHKVRSGETLGHIARRYGTSVSAIKRTNGLRSNLIRAGKSYRIPRYGGVRRVPGAMKPPARHVPPSTPVILASVNWTPAGYAPPVVTPMPMPVVAVADESIQPAPQTGATYTVRAGDNLSTIAARHNTTVARLREMNTLHSTTIHVGQRLVVGSGGTASSVRRSPRYTYKVKPGDSLWAIARANGTTVDSLKALNDLKSTSLAVGQKLWLKNPPSGGTAGASSPYTVRSGDNLSVIAQKHGVSVTDLRTWNGLKSDSIRPGQKLTVRAASRTADSTVRYRVKSGDSLWEIARSHGVSVAEVRSWNGLTTDTLRPGQRLVLYPSK